MEEHSQAHEYAPEDSLHVQNPSWPALAGLVDGHAPCLRRGVGVGGHTRLGATGVWVQGVNFRRGVCVGVRGQWLRRGV